jgi:hypothetical protein
VYNTPDCEPVIEKTVLPFDALTVTVVGETVGLEGGTQDTTTYGVQASDNLPDS